MFIPIGTDATVYHRAWTTFAVIAANVLLFLFVAPENHLDLLTLEFGTIKPWQWITCTFTHGGILHVGMNMLFLWWFGQIVEGRIGSLRFLLLYLGIGAAEGLATQVLTLGLDEGCAIGASGVIYGLMVVAMVFTPETEVSLLFWFYSASRIFEMRLRSLAVFYLVVNFLGAAAFAFDIGTEVLHLIGAAAGLGAVFAIRGLGWWYEPPEDAPPADVREDLPPLELD